MLVCLFFFFQLTIDSDGSKYYKPFVQMAVNLDEEKQGNEVIGYPGNNDKCKFLRCRFLFLSALLFFLGLPMAKIGFERVLLRYTQYTW